MQRGPIENQKGTWGNTTIFSPSHHTFELQEIPGEKCCAYQYVVFSMGNNADELSATRRCTSGCRTYTREMWGSGLYKKCWTSFSRQ